VLRVTAINNAAASLAAPPASGLPVGLYNKTDRGGRIRRVIAGLFCSAAAAWAQGPEIARDGIVNEAANTPIGISDFDIARGARLIVRGTRFGDRLTPPSVKLLTRGNAIDLSVAPVDLATLVVRIPADAPLGPASLAVTVGGKTSPPHPVKVVAAQFGIYSENGKGWGPGRIQNVNPAGRTLNTLNNAASLSQTLALSGTGLGDAKTPAVFVGGKPAKVVSARVSAETGEILFQVPAHAPEGCFVPVQVSDAGPFVSNTVTVAIHNGGGACREPEYFPFAGWPEARIGIVAITRTAMGKQDAQPISDEAAAWFGKLLKLEKLNPYFLLPPPGTCTSQAEPWRGGFTPATLPSLLATRAAAEVLRAGDELTIDDGKTVRKLPAFRGTQGVFDRELSDLIGQPDRLLHFLSPAVLHIVGKGGADVGRVGIALNGPLPFEMRGEMGPVKRGKPLRLEWTDMTMARIAIVFANFVDEATRSRGMCYCVATPGATGLTIPATALAYFPPAGSGARIALTVSAWPLRPVPFQAAGLDHGLALSVYMQHSSTGPNPSSFRERN